MPGDRLSDRARGRWAGLLPQLGVDTKFLRNRHGPCPMCGGKDRWRWDDRDGRGTWICSHCGAGDGVELVMRVNGIDFKEAAERIEALIGTTPYRAPTPERSDAQKRDGLRRLWNGAKPVCSGDPVSRWLHRRVGLTAVPSSLRFHPNTMYRDDAARSWHPAMIAKLTNPDGTPATLHRTYLTLDGMKAAVPKVRSVMPASIPLGCAVRLFPPAETMGIAEGIETSFAAADLFAMPVWAATNADILSKWVPPAETRAVVVFADNDANGVGQKAAAMVAGRLLVEGFKVEVKLPSAVDTDWNDVWTSEMKGAA